MPIKYNYDYLDGRLCSPLIISSSVYQIQVIQKFQRPSLEDFSPVTVCISEKVDSKSSVIFSTAAIKKDQISERVIVRLDEFFSSQVKVNI
jgi:hypothetical protein